MSGIALHYTGAAKELLVASYLTQQGYDVFTPVMMHARCDLVYLSDRAVRVQVKTSSKSRAGVSGFSYEQCRLVGDRRGGGDGHAYKESEIDEVWVVGTHLWRFPIEAVAGRTSLFLNSNNPDPTQRRRDYDPNEFVEVWGEWAAPFRDRLSFNANPDDRQFNKSFAKL